VEILMEASSEGANRWLSPQNTAVIFTGLTSDVDITTRPITRRDLHGLCLGDSITEGVRTLASGTSPTELGNQARTAYAYPLTELLGAEIGCVGFGATGISRGGSGNVPKFPDSAPYLWDGQARDLTTPKAPDFILAHIGTNDSASADADVLADTLRLLNQWIAATPSTTRIIVAAGWLQRKADQILQACSTCTAPARVTYLNTSGWWSTADASDALHPYGYANTTTLSPRLAAAIRTILAGPAAPAPAPAGNVYIRAADGSAVPIQSMLHT
jgi:hypothetical protein